MNILYEGLGSLRPAVSMRLKEDKGVELMTQGSAGVFGPLSPGQHDWNIAVRDSGKLSSCPFWLL